MQKIFSGAAIQVIFLRADMRVRIYQDDVRIFVIGNNTAQGVTQLLSAGSGVHAWIFVIFFHEVRHVNRDLRLFELFSQRERQTRRNTI